MKSPQLILIIAALGVAGAWIFWQSTAERRNGDRIVRAVENYREAHGHLPDPNDRSVMEKLGFEFREGWHPDFELGESGNYRVTFIEGFDGPYWTYDSRTGSWRNDF